MQILLVNPWITDFAAYDFWIKPLGLLYTGAFLRERGYDLRLIDCLDRFQPGVGIDPANRHGRFNTGKFHRAPITKPASLAHVPRQFARYGIPHDLFVQILLDGPRPDVVLVTSVMTYWYQGVIEAIALIREHLPGVPVVLGGIYATLCPDHARATSGADLVVTGGTPFEIVTAVERITGIEGNGPIPADHFATWPRPPWDLYDTIRTATVMTTRGCPLDCAVCASRTLFDGFERRDPVSAADEILDLAVRGVEDVAFGDDALLLDAPRHAIPLFERLAAEGAPVRLHTPNGLHVRAITPDLARLMHRAGMRTIRLSLETASPDRIADFSSKVSRDDFFRAVDALRDAGFDTADLGAYILVGLPDQSPEEVEATIAFAVSCNVPVKPALFSPVPRTTAFDRAVEYGMIAHDSDPVLQNNTLRTLDWFERWPGGYRGFKAWIEEISHY